MTEIKGIIAAMQTAMHEDGSINEAELRRQINRQIDAGVDAVFCLGTNGGVCTSTASFTSCPLRKKSG